MKPPKKIFQSLQGTWILSRMLLSANPKFSPSGKMQGVAKFTPIGENEMHYGESGQFITDTGDFEVKAEYAYSYGAKEERIEKFFFRNGKKANHFYTLKIEDSKLNEDLKATGEHQCSKDNYQATYKFFGETHFNKFSLTYRVKGPNKDYVSEAIFERDLSETHLKLPSS